MTTDATIASPAYRGRFAPSPTGPLHFGSLVAALGSFLQARAAGGEWLVRIEDVDTPRSVPGAADAILRDLDRCALHWDGAVTWQSRRGDLYRDALERLARAGATFPCACSRRDLVEGVYPGTCRAGVPAGRTARSVRLRVSDETLAFADRVQGRFAQHLSRDVGDFVLMRADGLFAYHLAVVVDDAAQGITEVVRGADLLDSTPRQLFLQRVLGVAHPAYAHLPVAVDEAGRKLGKQTRAPALTDVDPGRALAAALGFLGHAPEAGLAGAAPAELVDWARRRWRLAGVPRRAELRAPVRMAIPAGLG